MLGIKVARSCSAARTRSARSCASGQWRFRVVGVLAPRGRSLGFDMDDVVLIPVRTAMRMFNRTTLFRILIEVRAAKWPRQAGRGGADASATAPRTSR